MAHITVHGHSASQIGTFFLLVEHVWVWPTLLCLSGGGLDHSGHWVHPGQALGTGPLPDSSWVWLILELVPTILLMVLLPSTFLGAFKNAGCKESAGKLSLPRRMLGSGTLVHYRFRALFAIVLPLILLLFYRKSDVRETCRQRDPVERWTEQVPLPLLAASLLFGFGALYYGLTGIAAPFFPFFGRYTTGLPAGIACLSGGLYQFRTSCFVFQNNGRLVARYFGCDHSRGAAIATTIGRANLPNAYARMGMSSQQLQMMQSSPIYSYSRLVGGFCSSN